MAHFAIPPIVEPWMERLRAAVAAGYYRTESDERLQERFPWQDRTCGDCPFWRAGFCRVRLARRDRHAHTCSYFDRPNREAARLIIEGRRSRGDWMNDYLRRFVDPE